MVLSLFLVLLGLLLLFLELAVIPGFGIVGLLGLGALGGGIALIWGGLGTLWGVVTLLVSIPVCAGLVVWFMRSRAGNRLVLHDAITGHSSDVPMQTHLIGKKGTALTTLRPAGTALIDTERLDVVSEGEFIAKGSEIEVVRIEGNSIVVTNSGGGV